jgi:hypothetical protein
LWTVPGTREKLRPRPNQPSPQAEITPLYRQIWSKRRVEPRYQCGPATPARVADRRGQNPQRVWVLNLSLGGAGLLLAEPLAAGTPIVVHLKTESPPRFYELPARVAHSTARVNGDWVVGCAFSDRLTPDDLEALLA